MEHRLIDAFDFLDLFYVASAGQDKSFVATVEMVVKDTPTVDAEPVRHGKWGPETIIGYDGLHVIYARTCSKCQYEIECRFEKNYCPNCGAKMDGGVNE